MFLKKSAVQTEYSVIFFQDFGSFFEKNTSSVRYPYRKVFATIRKIAIVANRLVDY